jgi:hypothetical protein
MPSYVCSTAQMQCNMGSTPSVLTVLPIRNIFLCNKPKANISDFQPLVNIAPFGLCRSLANPTVASATSAAMGTLTPMPCIPNTTSPWMNGKTDHLVQGQPALMDNCQLMCVWGGAIKLTSNGQI